MRAPPNAPPTRRTFSVGYVEREGPNGPHEEPCRHCYGGLGEVRDEDDDE